MKKKVLISAPYFIPVADKFKGVFDEHNIDMVIADVNERLSEEELLPIIGEMDGVICGDDRFTEKVLAAAKKLKVISKWGTGTDSIDKDACARLNILVKNTPNAFTEPVSDSVMCYILCFARKIPWMDKAMKANIWEKIPGVSLHEATLGIIGMGNIGKAVARKAAAFGMRILGNDIKDIDKDFVASVGVEVVDKECLYREADFISLNCDLNQSSFHLIDKNALAQMAKKPFIINTARGHIIKERDLVDALDQGIVAGAGLDVFEQEPLPSDSRLLMMDNVLLAPHNSNSSPSAWERVHENTVKNLLEGLEE